ncbi:MAG: DNA adenine methylase [Bacteroidota bacterium]
MGEVKYPKVNYIGNKEKISAWICDQFPKEAKTVLDAFSGGASLSYEAKRRGYTVYSNDILKVNYHLARALIENSETTFSAADLDLIFDGKPIKGFMYENYKDVFFFDFECEELDLYRENINRLNDDYKVSLAFSLMRRAMIRKMPYSRFTIPWETVKQLRNEEYSYEKYGRKRAYHNKSIKTLFLDNLSEYQKAIFDNGKKNEAYCGDIFSAVEAIKADVIYLDPPYGGTMNNYFGFYGMLDEYIDSVKKSPFDNNFMKKDNSLHLLDELCSKLTHFKYWYLSYNNRAYPNKEDILKMLSKYSNDIQIIEKEHTYKITGKENKNKNIEYLFILKYDRNRSSY